MTKKFLITIALGAITISSILFFWHAHTPTIIAIPDHALIDVPVEISVRNLKPNELITLEASCTDKSNNEWKSYASFQADNKGVVNVATQMPISGSYHEIDPMGLIWSMAPTNTDSLKQPLMVNFNEISLSVIIGDKTQAQKTIYRLPVSPSVEKRSIREQGIVGTLFYQKNILQAPGVIVVSGSGGRIPEDISQLLASHGYTVLALAYFREQGLPKRLKNIPLEYFEHAMQWFKEQPQVDKDHIALCGRSRGGELVLLLAATFPDQMQAAIAYVPSGIMWNHAWAYNNVMLPSILLPSDEEETEARKQGLIPSHAGTFDDPEEATPIYEYLLKKATPKELAAATIPVEKITCPILLISGEDDKMWPSTLLSTMVMDRLDEKKSTIERKHLHFPATGHGVQNPYGPSASIPYAHPMAKTWMTIGGTAQGNARAHKQAWQEVLDFLQKTLRK